MKSPAFRFFPSDFWGSPDVQAMELQEVGAYLALLSVAWLSERHGYLPDDDEKLRRWARMTREQWGGSRDLLLSKFPMVEPGWRANPRMVEEAVKQSTFSESQKRKAEKRWSTSEAVPIESQSDAENMPGHAEKDAGGMPSVSVSVAKEKQKQEREPMALVFAKSEDQVVRKQSFSDQSAEPIWKLWPNKNGKQQGLESIRKALRHLERLGTPNPGDDLADRVKAWLARCDRKRAAGEFVPSVPYAQKWFGDTHRRYLDPEAEPPAITKILTPDGRVISTAESEAEGWVPMRGEA